jgi:hypothetical protein
MGVALLDGGQDAGHVFHRRKRGLGGPGGTLWPAPGAGRGLVDPRAPHPARRAVARSDRETTDECSSWRLAMPQLFSARRSPWSSRQARFPAMPGCGLSVSSISKSGSPRPSPAPGRPPRPRRPRPGQVAAAIPRRVRRWSLAPPADLLNSVLRRPLACGGRQRHPLACRNSF